MRGRRNFDHLFADCHPSANQSLLATGFPTNAIPSPPPPDAKPDCRLGSTPLAPQAGTPPLIREESPRAADRRAADRCPPPERQITALRVALRAASSKYSSTPPPHPPTHPDPPRSCLSSVSTMSAGARPRITGPADRGCSGSTAQPSARPLRAASGEPGRPTRRVARARPPAGPAHRRGLLKDTPRRPRCPEDPLRRAVGAAAAVRRRRFGGGRMSAGGPDSGAPVGGPTGGGEPRPRPIFTLSCAGLPISHASADESLVTSVPPRDYPAAAAHPRCKLPIPFDAGPVTLTAD